MGPHNSYSNGQTSSEKVIRIPYEWSIHYDMCFLQSSLLQSPRPLTKRVGQIHFDKYQILVQKINKLTLLKQSFVEKYVIMIIYGILFVFLNKIDCFSPLGACEMMLHYQQSLQSYDYWLGKLFQVVELNAAPGHFCHIKIVLEMISTTRFHPQSSKTPDLNQLITENWAINSLYIFGGQDNSLLRFFSEL